MPLLVRAHIHYFDDSLEFHPRGSILTKIAKSRKNNSTGSPRLEGAIQSPCKADHVGVIMDKATEYAITRINISSGF